MKANIGVCGLGVMGRSLALNLAEHGYDVAVYNYLPEPTREFAASANDGRIIPCYSPEEFVAAIRKPSPILMMITAGSAVDEQIRVLAPLMAKGDVLMDGGNSRFQDTRRRGAELADKGILYLGVGVSGGEEGARNGPAIMPGGPKEAYDIVEPILADIAAKADGRACCSYIGADGAGHYVKMVHNGIEYADMQLIAEAYYFLRHVAGMGYRELRQTFLEWNKGELSSYLMEITADIFGRTDPETDKPICEVILDRAAQKGTGAWTGENALELGIPAPTIVEAVFARGLSALKEQRVRASSVLIGTGMAGKATTANKAQLISYVHDALYAAKICCYAQGFALLQGAAKQYSWNLNPGEIALIWRGGCIIRAGFLNRIKEAYDRDPNLDNLLLDPYFTEATAKTHHGWREVVVLSALLGVPSPAFSSALAYYDGYRSGFLWANLIQAQRDYFGAHTYERVDKPGSFHTKW